MCWLLLFLLVFFVKGFEGFVYYNRLLECLVVRKALSWSNALVVVRLYVCVLLPFEQLRCLRMPIAHWSRWLYIPSWLQVGVFGLIHLLIFLLSSNLVIFYTVEPKIIAKLRSQRWPRHLAYIVSVFIGSGLICWRSVSPGLVGRGSLNSASDTNSVGRKLLFWAFNSFKNIFYFLVDLVDVLDSWIWGGLVPQGSILLEPVVHGSKVLGREVVFF